MGEDEIRAIVRAAVEEFAKAEPGYQAELAEARKQREGLELKVSELVAENSRSKAAMEEAERSSTIRAELQKLGIAKVDLAYRAVKDDIQRTDDGRLAARGGEDLKEYLTRFATENPELLPARLTGGSGAGGGTRAANSGVDIDKIRPGMSPEELERVRQEIARVAMQTMRGL